jgi:hypothetical protein
MQITLTVPRIDRLIRKGINRRTNGPARPARSPVEKHSKSENLSQLMKGGGVLSG